MDPYVPILFLIAVAVVLPLAMVAVSTAFGPRVKASSKGEAYESGVPPVGSVRAGIPVKFYRLAILFLIFDVEVAFLFPWAVLYRAKIQAWGKPFLLVELAAFLFILVAGYVYAWKKGALEWD